MKRLARIAVAAAILVGCSACLGSAARAPKVEPTRFAVTYIPPIGNLMGPSSLYPPRHRLVRCGGRNRALCAAIAYYATHHPRTCSQNLFSTPAQFGVRGTLRGRRVAEAVAPICRRSPARLATAERVMFFSLIRPHLAPRKSGPGPAARGLAPLVHWRTRQKGSDPAWRVPSASASRDSRCFAPALPPSGRGPRRVSPG